MFIWAVLLTVVLRGGHGTGQANSYTEGEDVNSPPGNEPRLNEPQAPRPTGLLFKNWRYHRSLRSYADALLIVAAINALDSKNGATSDNLERLVRTRLDVTTSRDDMLTPHERVLDNWRIVATFLLIGALFTAIVLAVIENNKSAGPYISLSSGLAGIALGWMFANAGATTRISSSPQSSQKNDSAVALETDVPSDEGTAGGASRRPSRGRLRGGRS
jgi:hypothetical protein